MSFDLEAAFVKHKSDRTHRCPDCGKVSIGYYDDTSCYGISKWWFCGNCWVGIPAAPNGDLLNVTVDRIWEESNQQMSKKMRRMEGESFLWEILHWFTMTFLKHRLVRGYSLDTGKLVCIYWDKASNWSSEGEDWHRLKVPYPKPIWEAWW